jgi:hypothetical protein
MVKSIFSNDIVLKKSKREKSREEDKSSLLPAYCSWSFMTNLFYPLAMLHMLIRSCYVIVFCRPRDPSKLTTIPYWDRRDRYDANVLEDAPIDLV